MLTNADITLLNKRYDPVQRLDVWKRTYMQGVSWMAAQETAGGGNGAILRENVVKIRIPLTVDAEGKAYAPAKAYAAGAENAWTLQNGDYLVRGQVTEDMTIKEMQARYDNVYQIVGFADNRRGGLPHWRVTGK